jgi:hypothetical protein
MGEDEEAGHLKAALQLRREFAQKEAYDQGLSSTSSHSEDSDSSAGRGDRRPRHLQHGGAVGDGSVDDDADGQLGEEEEEEEGLSSLLGSSVEILGI